MSSSYTDLTDAVMRSLDNLLRKGMLRHDERSSRQIVCAAARRWVANMQPMAPPAAADDVGTDVPVAGVPAGPTPGREPAAPGRFFGDFWYDERDD